MTPEELLKKMAEVRFETFKKILVQTVPCRAAALDLRNGRATVLALRQMQYEDALSYESIERIYYAAVIGLREKKWWCLIPMVLTFLESSRFVSVTDCPFRLLSRPEKPKNCVSNSVKP
jgi:hypothetical protein